MDKQKRHSHTNESNKTELPDSATALCAGGLNYLDKMKVCDVTVTNDGGGEDIIYTCCECKAEFNTPERLKRHCLNVHNGHAWIRSQNEG
jgi:hypothetical protein